MHSFCSWSFSAIFLWEQITLPSLHTKRSSSKHFIASATTKNTQPRTIIEMYTKGTIGRSGIHSQRYKNRNHHPTLLTKSSSKEVSFRPSQKGRCLQTLPLQQFLHSCQVIAVSHVGAVKLSDSFMKSSSRVFCRQLSPRWAVVPRVHKTPLSLSPLSLPHLSLLDQLFLHNRCLRFWFCATPKTSIYIQKQKLCILRCFTWKQWQHPTTYRLVSF